MLSGRSSAEKAERRAAKTQSLYVATPSSSSFAPNATSSGFIAHHHRHHQLQQQQQQQQEQHQSFPTISTTNKPLDNTSSSHTPKSPKKVRPFSMMFMHPQEESLKQQQYSLQHGPGDHSIHGGGGDPHLQHHNFQQQQHQQQLVPESDEDFVPDSHSLGCSSVDYGENDMRDVDTDTRTLIAHLTDLDRSVMEAEYGTNILKLASGLRDTYRQQSSEGPINAHVKQGSYGEGWSLILEMHERLGNNRLEFSRDLQVVSEELSAIYKETDRSRKQFKEAGAKQERIVQEHEQNLEKAKQKYDTLTEEWERAILQKAADPTAPKKTMSKTMAMNIFRQPKSVSQLHRQEEEARAKATAAHEQYKAQLAKTNDIRQYYFARTLPSILKNLKDTIDESDMSLQYYLMRYGYMYEDYLMKDGMVLTPINGTDLGLRDRVDNINKDADLQAFIHAYSTKANPVQRAAAPYQEYTMSAQAQSIINPRPIFGVDLAEQLIRDETDLPEIVIKCTEAIERYGMDTQGIYRVSGVTSVTNRLRAAFDRDCSAVDLTTDENCGDVNSVASVLKTWFRELPEPLLTRQLYPEFIKAASIEDPALQLMNLHQVTNQLPDPNYATLKFLMCHLNRIQANQAVNKMGASNLGLIFGPTLTSSSGGGAVDELVDMGLQCRIIETLLSNYGAIFDIDEVDEEEELEGEQEVDGHYGQGGGHYLHHPQEDGVVPEMMDNGYGSQSRMVSDDPPSLPPMSHKPFDDMMMQDRPSMGEDTILENGENGKLDPGQNYASYATSVPPPTASRYRQSVYGQIQEEEEVEGAEDGVVEEGREGRMMHRERM
ncbi:hypothetical protein BGZ94_004500 [Podila epigama]|nr:hypothetical protein BGZ94_004500 [Podila epigama]